MRFHLQKFLHFTDNALFDGIVHWGGIKAKKDSSYSIQSEKMVASMNTPEQYLCRRISHSLERVPELDTVITGRSRFWMKVYKL